MRKKTEEKEFHAELFKLAQDHNVEGLISLLSIQGNPEKVNLEHNSRYSETTGKNKGENLLLVICKHHCSSPSDRRVTMEMILNTPGAKRTLNSSCSLHHVLSLKMKRLETLIEEIKVIIEAGGDPTLRNGEKGLNALEYLIPYQGRRNIIKLN